MNRILRYLITTTLSLLIATNVGSQDLKLKATDKLLSIKDKKINSLSNQVTSGINSYVNNLGGVSAGDSLGGLKYIDFDLKLQEYYKPTFSIMSVYELIELNNGGTIFNQTSLNTHDSDETINIGLGVRKLLNDNKVIIGANTFYDHQFDESHKRLGLGVEAITSIFDLRGNYYNAMSGRRTNKEGSYTERALDGWDLRTDYHLPIKYDVNLYLSAYKFKNPEDLSTFEDKGNRYGADAKIGNFAIEAGWENNNQDTDNYYGNLKYLVNFGGEDSNEAPKSATSLTDVSDKLYQPIKRENKIRVVKIAASGVSVGGF